MRRRRREASVRSERGELRFAPGGGPDRPARRDAGASRATCEVLDRRVEDGVLDSGSTTRTRWRGSGRRCPARTPARCCSRRRPAYEFVDWGGADHVGGGSHGSLHRNDSLGALILVRHGPRRPATSGRAVDAARRGGPGPASTSARPRRPAARLALTRMVEETSAVAPPVRLHRRVRHGLRHPGNWFAARCASAPSAPAATSSTSRSSRSSSTRVGSTTGSPRSLAFVVAVVEQLLVEPPLDVRRRATGTPASRPRASSPSASSRSLFSLVILVAAGRAAPGSPKVPAQAIAIVRRDAAARSSATSSGASGAAERRRALAAGRLRCLIAAPAPSHRRRAPAATLTTDPNALDPAARSWHEPPIRAPARGQAGDRDRRSRQDRSSARSAACRARPARRSSRAPRAGRSRYFTPRTAHEIAQVSIDDLTGQRARGLDRLPGRVDDGARLRGRVRAQGQRAVRVDPAVRAVRRAVPRSAAARSACCTSTCSCCSASRVSLAFFNRGAHRAVGRRSPTRRCSTCSCACCWSGCAAGGRRASRCGCSCRCRGWRSRSCSWSASASA